MASNKVLLLVLTIFHAIAAVPLFDDVQKPISKVYDPSYRLPDSVIPSEYRIKIKPYMKQADGDRRFTFDGEVEIDVMTSLANITKIVLHSKGLEFHENYTNIEPNLEIIDVKHNETYDFLQLTLNTAMVVDQKYTLSMKFEGKMMNDATGLYRSSYRENNQTKWLATTQFQPVYARKVFPCFDEPMFKAVFKLTIDCPSGYQCISNMKIKNSTNTQRIFEDTPKMSTYLLAFIVSEYQNTVSMVDDKFSVWSRPEAKNQSEYALEVGAKLVTQMEKYTNIRYYTLPNNITMKMDAAAIPDLSGGAMENWGLMTYREAYLMVDPNETTTAIKQLVTNILAHEIAHMWFGDLVTCYWWSDTWLNEGFARYFEYKLPLDITPGFHLDDQFIIAQVHTAMAADSSIYSHPLTNFNVNSPSEVKGQFGTISYNKGASVIRMMEHWIGSDTFKKGLHVHLANRTYDVVSPKDLFNSLQAVTDDDNSTAIYGISVETVFRSWTSISGYPVLMVSMNHTDHSVYLKQKRFLLNGEGVSTNLYLIPITYATKENPDFNNTKPKFIMHNEAFKVNRSEHSWIIFNVQQTGFYRVHYDKDLYDLIIDDFTNDTNREAVHQYNRAQLVDDAFNFAKEGMMKYSRMFEIIQFLENETDYTPWSAAYAGVNQLRPRFQTFSELVTDFHKHILTLMAKVVDSLGLDVGDGDDDLKKIFRSQTLNLACSIGHEACVDSSLELFERWINDNTFYIPVDHRQFVYCTGLREGKAEYFDHLWSKYINGNVVNEKVLILSALGCTKSKENIEMYLSHTLDPEETIKAHDRMTAFNSAVGGNPENVGYAWGFFKNHVQQFREAYGSDSIPTLLNAMTVRMSDEQLTEISEYLVANNNFTTDEIVAGLNSVRQAEKTLDWTRSVEGDIRSWIKAKYNSANAVVGSLMLMMTMVTISLFNL